MMSWCVLQEPAQRPVAAALPHAAERAGLRLPAEPAAPPWRAGVRPAAELQQQTVESEEPPGGAVARGSQGSAEMTTAPLPTVTDSPSNVFIPFFQTVFKNWFKMTVKFWIF